MSIQEHNFIENELIIFTKATCDTFLKNGNFSELFSLYGFYYYTAKWQKTNQPKCTTEYVAKNLHWSKDKVIKVKKQLLEFGLIEDAKHIDEQGRVKGHYIKMNYIFKKDTLSTNIGSIQGMQTQSQCVETPENVHTPLNPEGGFEGMYSGKINEYYKNSCENQIKPDSYAKNSTLPKIQRVESEETNALSNNNINALSTNKENNTNIRNNSITHISITKENSKTEQKKEKTQTEKPIEKNNQLIKILSDRIPNKKARHLFVDFLNDRKDRLSLPVTYNFIMDALKYLDQYAGDDPEEIINVIHASIERGRGWIERVYTKNKKAVLTERSYDIKTLDEEYDIIAETGFQEETGDFLNTHKVDDDVKSTDFERISAELLAEDMETKKFKQREEQKKAKIQELNDKIREIQDKIKSTESNIEKQSLTIKLKELQVELALI